MYPISDYLTVKIIGKNGSAEAKNEYRSLVVIEGFDMSEKLKHNFIKTPSKEYSFVSVFVFDKDLNLTNRKVILEECHDSAAALRAFPILPGILTERRKFIDKTTGEQVDKDCAVRIKVDYERVSQTLWTTQADTEVAQMMYPVIRSTKTVDEEAGTTTYEYEDTGDVVYVISKDNPAVAFGTRFEWNAKEKKTDEVMVKWENGGSVKVDPATVGV